MKPVLNARALSCVEVHVQLTKTSAVTVNHLKLIRSVKANSFHFSQLCYTFTGHQLNVVYYVSLFTSRFSSLGATMATIYVYAIGSVYFRGACWHPLAYDVIIMQFTVVMIRRLILIFHLHSITIQNSAYLDSNSYIDSDVSCVLSEASSVIIFQLRRKGQRYKECSGQKRCFWHTSIRRIIQDVQKLQEVWKIWQSQKTQENSWE